jgi:hypothetical protein
LAGDLYDANELSSEATAAVTAELAALKKEADALQAETMSVSSDFRDNLRDVVSAMHRHLSAGSEALARATEVRIAIGRAQAIRPRLALNFNRARDAGVLDAADSILGDLAALRQIVETSVEDIDVFKQPDSVNVSAKVGQDALTFSKGVGRAVRRWWQ